MSQAMSAVAAGARLLLVLALLVTYLDLIECRKQQGEHAIGSNELQQQQQQQQHQPMASSSSTHENQTATERGRRGRGRRRHADGVHGEGGGGGGGGGRGRGGRGGGGGKRGDVDNGGKGRKRAGHHRKRDGQSHHHRENDLSLWINEQQLAMLSGYAQGRIYAIERGHVFAEIRDDNIYKFLTVPAEVNHVNFTWKSGNRKYFYHFDRLQSLDESILKAPIISIKTKGRIPQEERDFSIFLPCNANSSGIATFNIGLSIENRRGKPLPGTPLRFSFKKECAHRGVYDDAFHSYTSSASSAQEPDPECQLKCGNNGYCNHNKICQCKAGYTGQYCQTAFCFPACLNGGNCTAPSVCTCPEGYQGTQCEGGICRPRCLNGGKCVQKDTCECSKGYYGLHCEYCKCVIPCRNGGRCVGNNKCACPEGLQGDHCEIGSNLQQQSSCKRPCRHGVCMRNKRCKCDEGFQGRFCNSKIKKIRKSVKSLV